MLDPTCLDLGAGENLLLAILEKLSGVAAEASDDETRR